MKLLYLGGGKMRGTVKSEVLKSLIIAVKMTPFS